MRSKRLNPLGRCLQINGDFSTYMIRSGVWTAMVHAPRKIDRPFTALNKWTRLLKRSWVLRSLLQNCQRMNYGENYQASDIGFRLALGFVFLK